MRIANSLKINAYVKLKLAEGRYRDGCETGLALPVGGLAQSGLVEAQKNILFPHGTLCVDAQSIGDIC